MTLSSQEVTLLRISTALLIDKYNSEAQRPRDEDDPEITALHRMAAITSGLQAKIAEIPIGRSVEIHVRE